LNLGLECLENEGDTPLKISPDDHAVRGVEVREGRDQQCSMRRQACAYCGLAVLTQQSRSFLYEFVTLIAVILWLLTVYHFYAL
jgi:hypothetical protein